MNINALSPFPITLKYAYKYSIFVPKNSIAKNTVLFMSRVHIGILILGIQNKTITIF